MQLENTTWFYEMVKNYRKENSDMHTFWYDEDDNLVASRIHGFAYDDYNWVGGDNQETLDFLKRKL